MKLSNIFIIKITFFLFLIISEFTCISCVYKKKPVKKGIWCPVGYGQRGLRYEYGITWPHFCPLVLYCFEGVTEDIEKVKKLIDFPWDPYYLTYYIKGCGGDYGMPIDYHPYRGPYFINKKGITQKGPRLDKIYRVPGYVQINLTTPTIVTGHGGTETFGLEYICRTDMCNGGFKTSSFSTVAIIATIFTTLITCQYFM